MTLKLHIHFTNLIQYSRRLCVVIYKGWPSAHHCKCSYRSPCGKQKSLFDKVILHVWENVKMWDQLLNFNFKVFFSHTSYIWEIVEELWSYKVDWTVVCFVLFFFLTKSTVEFVQHGPTIDLIRKSSLKSTSMALSRSAFRQYL